MKSVFVKIKSSRDLYIYSAIVGFCTGLLAIIFSYMLAFSEHIILDVIVGAKRIHPTGEFHVDFFSVKHETYQWMFLFLPAVGGFISGLLTYHYSRESEGSGIDLIIASFHFKDGFLNYRAALIKIFATLAVLSTGGSGGKEGPISFIGGGIGSFFSKLSHAGAKAQRALLLVGTAGALGAIFRAPLGGALTAVEMIYTDDIESDSLIPCIISSVISYLTFTTVNGKGSIFQVDIPKNINYSELIFYILLGFLCYLSGMLFILFFKQIKSFFNNLQIHPVLKPTLGGLLVGFIGYFIPEVIGQGGGYLQSILDGSHEYIQNKQEHVLLLFFISMGFLKTVTSSFTVGSGGSAGLFFPSLFIGGSIGGAVATLASILLEERNISLTSYVLVGMGGFYSAIARAPIAGMVMICEMIGSYVLLPPLMIVSMIAFTLTHKHAIYKGQVENRFKSPAHEWDLKAEIMDSITVESLRSDLKKEAIIQVNTLLYDIQKSAYEIQESDFIVVGNKNEYRGILSLKKIGLLSDSISNLVIIEDVLDATIPFILINQSIGKVFKIMLDHNIDKVAVVEDGEVIGYIKFNDILLNYKLYSSKTG